jgi:hypothetical protein
VRAVENWNRLPDWVRAEKKPDTFKRNLKKANPKTMEKPTKDSLSESLMEKIERSTGVKIRFYRWTVDHQLKATSILQVYKMVYHITSRRCLQ